MSDIKLNKGVVYCGDIMLATKVCQFSYEQELYFTGRLLDSFCENVLPKLKNPLDSMFSGADDVRYLTFRGILFETSKNFISLVINNRIIELTTFDNKNEFLEFFELVKKYPEEFKAIVSFVENVDGSDI